LGRVLCQNSVPTIRVPVKVLCTFLTGLSKNFASATQGHPNSRKSSVFPAVWILVVESNRNPSKRGNYREGRKASLPAFPLKKGLKEVGQRMANKIGEIPRKTRRFPLRLAPVYLLFKHLPSAPAGRTSASIPLPPTVFTSYLNILFPFPPNSITTPFLYM
jgi:hypothetical protein